MSLRGKLLSPWWAALTWWHKRRLYAIAGRGDRALGERLVKSALAETAKEEKGRWPSPW